MPQKKTEISRLLNGKILCVNKTVCRRHQLCEYFSRKYEGECSNCVAPCDNCQNQYELTKYYHIQENNLSGLDVDSKFEFKFDSVVINFTRRRRGG